MARKSSTITAPLADTLAATPSATPSLPGQGPANISLELAAAVHEALSRHYDKLSNRDALTAGAVYDVSLAISGQIDGERFEDICAGSLSVGHDSQTPPARAPVRPTCWRSSWRN